MTIMSKDFDFDEIRKARQRQRASGGVDLVTAINDISPEIGKLKAGQTAQVEIPDYKNTNADGVPVGLRKFVMSITAKLNNLTPKGQPWEGRSFRVASDGARYVYVQRGDDETPKERKARGPRSKSTSEAAEAVSKGETVTEKGGALVTEHA